MVASRRVVSTGFGWYEACNNRPPVTLARFWVAIVLFHAVVLGATWRLARSWRDPTRCRWPAGRWLGAVTRDGVRLGALAAVASVLSAVAANPDHLRRLALAAISSRLVGQALFGEAVLLAAVLSWRHAQAKRPGRALALGAIAAGLVGVYVDGYRVEPAMLEVRRHDVAGGASASDTGATVRILHLTDIQTPVIGPHE